MSELQSSNVVLLEKQGQLRSRYDIITLFSNYVVALVNLILWHWFWVCKYEIEVFQNFSYSFIHISVWILVKNNWKQEIKKIHDYKKMSNKNRLNLFIYQTRRSVCKESFYLSLRYFIPWTILAKLLFEIKYRHGIAN